MVMNSQDGVLGNSCSCLQEAFLSCVAQEIQLWHAYQEASVTYSRGCVEVPENAGFVSC